MSNKRSYVQRLGRAEQALNLLASGQSNLILCLVNMVGADTA